MSNYANIYRGRIGDLQGDIETTIYKVMSKGLNRLNVETTMGIVSIRKTDSGVRRIFLDDKPIVERGIDVAVDVLDILEAKADR